MESTLGADLARLVRQWRTVIDERLKPQGLTQSHWVTLHNINCLPEEQSQIQLAKAIGIEQPSLVRTLDQLEEKKLIVRHTCKNDRRAKKIQLTETAKPIIEHVNCVIIERTCKEILENIPKEDLEFLAKIIKKLEDNIIKLQDTKR